MTTRPPRRRGRVLPGLLVLLLLLVGLLVVADRVAAGYAERRLASEVAREARANGISTAGAPEVDVLGFPFLDQVVRGRYDGVQVTLLDVPTQGLRIGELQVRAEGLDLPLSKLASRDLAGLRADRVTSTGSVPYDELARAAGARGLRLTPDRGRIRATLPIEVAGVSGTITGVAGLRVEQGALRLRITELQVEGVELPGRLEDVVQQRVNERIAVPRLPYGLRLEAVTPGADGVQVRASARDVLLSDR